MSQAECAGRTAKMGCCVASYCKFPPIKINPIMNSVNLMSVFLIVCISFHSLATRIVLQIDTFPADPSDCEVQTINANTYTYTIEGKIITHQRKQIGLE